MDAPSAPGYPRISILVCGALAAVFLSGIVLAPVLETSGAPGGAALRSLYHPLCHQFPGRSLSIGGRPLAVCARCSGLYAAGTAALLLAAFLFPRMLRVRPVWFAAAWVPTLVDVLLRFLGREGLTSWPRLLIAVPAGFFAGLLLAEGLTDLAIRGPGRLRLGRVPRAAPRGI